MMWYPGVPSNGSLDVLRDMREQLDTPGGTSRVNDDQPPIQYTGSWNQSNNRGAGDHCDDVTYTSTNGDSVSIPFTGTGVSVLSPMGSSVSADVYLDGTLVTTVNWEATTYQPQQTLYSASELAAGDHEVRIVKRSGQYLQIDAVDFTP